MVRFGNQYQSITYRNYITMNDNGQQWDQGGRPKTDDPADGTRRNRISARKTEVINWLDDNREPAYLRIDDLVTNDTDRIIHYCSEQILYSGVFIYICPLHMWIPLTKLTDDIGTAIRSLIVKSRKDAATTIEIEYGTGTTSNDYRNAIEGLTLSNNHIYQVFQTLRTRISDMKYVPDQDMNDRTKHPILPYTTGTGHNLRTYELLKPEEIRSMHLVDTGWKVQRLHTETHYKGEDREIFVKVRKILETRYKEVADRYALYLAGLNAKRIDVIRYPTDGGKSTWHFAINAAMPGVFGRTEGRGITQENSSRFTPITNMLTKHAAVMLDELHDDVVLSVGFLNRLTDPEQAQESKGVDRKNVKVMGSVILAANEEGWPNFNSDAQGWHTRFKWCVDRSDIEPLTDEERHWMIDTEPGRACIQDYIIERCGIQLGEHGSAQKARSVQEDACKDTVKAMRDETADPLSSWLRSEYVVTGTDLTISTDSITEAANAALDEKITSRKVGKAVKKVFRQGFKDKKVSDFRSNKMRGFRGIARREVNSI